MFKIIIIGGGHSGLEAANIITKFGCKVLLITKNLNNIGALSCNPSIGGVAKSILVREIDSIGGLMGYMATKSSIQLKRINFSKGESVSCIRSQLSRTKYKNLSKNLITKNKNIRILQKEVLKIIIKNNQVQGVKTIDNIVYKSNNVILCTGTFLNSFINIGFKNYNYGRMNEKSSIILSNQLKFILKSSRFKTGTPPRIDKNIDFKNLKIQKGDFNPVPSLCSWYSNNRLKIQQNCWVAKTNIDTINIVKKNLKSSPLYNNLITGVSPRYCPSIEDKVYKFNKKINHNIFLEPDSKNLLYPSGISTSLNKNSQRKLIKSIKGLENCKIIKYGYSVEYDFFCPKNLKKSLESKIIKGLFIAGQVNGTTGYEEAAAQGIIAGINAVMSYKNKKYWYPNKKNSYIGMLLNDIISNGVTEPYRVFTRRNNNLNLREDNSNKRLLYVVKMLKLNLNRIVHNKLKNLNYNNIYSKNNLELNKILERQLYIYKKYKNYLIFKKKYTLKKKINLPYNINYFKIKGLPKEMSEKLNYFKPLNMKNALFSNFGHNFFNIVFNFLNKNFKKKII